MWAGAPDPATNFVEIITRSCLAPRGPCTRAGYALRVAPLSPCTWVRSDRGGTCGRAGVRYRDLHGKAESVQSRALWVRTPEEDASNLQDHSESIRSGKGRHATTSRLSDQLPFRSSATRTAVSGRHQAGLKTKSAAFWTPHSGRVMLFWPVEPNNAPPPCATFTLGDHAQP